MIMLRNLHHAMLAIAVVTTNVVVTRSWLSTCHIAVGSKNHNTCRSLSESPLTPPAINMVDENDNLDAQQNFEQILDDYYNDESLSTRNDFDKENELSKWYRHDPDDDDATIVDEDGLRSLLSKRYHARKRKEYGMVDTLDQELLENHKVRVYDNPNVWTTQTKAPASYLRQRARKQAQRLKDVFGPTGHPYQQVGGAIDPILCPLTMTEIHTHLSKMQQCRIRGQYDQAEAMKFELMLNGVQVNEATKCWCADGETKLDDDFEMAESREGPTVVPEYTEYPPTKLDGSSLDSITQQRVEQLVKQRSDSIARGEMELAAFL